jgi:multidrug efflux pump subunit AcrB
VAVLIQQEMQAVQEALAEAVMAEIIIILLALRDHQTLAVVVVPNPLVP